MKRNFFMAFMLVLAFTCFADEYDLGNIPETHYGIWIPREFDNTFKKDCNYIKALHNNSTIKAHDILIISKNHIQSDKGFHDGYAIPKSEFKDFILKMNGNIPELTDGNKNEYVLISKSTDDYREIFVNYLTAEIGKRLKKYNPEKAMYVKENNFYIQSQYSEYGPYGLIPDLFVMSINGIANDYDFIMADATTYYGVHLEKNKIEIDEFIEKIKLRGNTIIGDNNSFEVVRVFSME